MMTHEEFDEIAALSPLGATTAAEERALEEHLESCADCRTAAAEYREAAAGIGRSLSPVTPPDEVRRRILDAAPARTDAAEERGAEGGNLHAWWLATAATLFLALWGWREFGIRVSRERIQSQNAEIQRLDEQNRRLELQRDRLATEMAALASPGAQPIALQGQEIAPSASARVFLEPDRRRAIVFFTDLPENPNDKSYQLWVIRADQPAPQSVGVFDVEKGKAVITIENLPVATAIKGLAVTLEQRGGADQPSSSTFYVAGNT